MSRKGTKVDREGTQPARPARWAAPFGRPTAVEHGLLKAVCGLPPSVQRRLFGSAPCLDGQTLASDVQVLLRMLALAGNESLIDGLSVAQARAENRLGAAATARRPPLAMARIETVGIPGPDGPIGARHYVPRGLQRGVPAPLLVYFHGGGWVMGDLDSHDGVCRFLAAEAAVTVLSVDYRLAPEHPYPAAVRDCWAAFRWALDSAHLRDVDPARIAVGGDSAGGNLAAVVSLLARDAGGAPPAMQLLLYPATEAAGEQRSRRLFASGFLLTKGDIDRCEAHYLPAGADPADPQVSVLRATDLSDLPRTYLATGGFDPLRDEGEEYARRMREAGVEVALRRHSGLTHAFANLTAVSRSSRAAMLEAAGALRAALAIPRE